MNRRGGEGSDAFATPNRAEALVRGGFDTHAVYRDSESVGDGRADIERARHDLRGLCERGDVEVDDLPTLLVEQIFETIQRLNREQGLTILLVEQDVRLALRVASYGYILENGEVNVQGPSERLLDDPAVRRAYLGV